MQPQFERFLFVTSNRPIDAQAVVDATRAWAMRGFPPAGPSLEGDAQLSDLTLVKEAP